MYLFSNICTYHFMFVVICTLYCVLRLLTYIVVIMRCTFTMCWGNLTYRWENWWQGADLRWKIQLQARRRHGWWGKVLGNNQDVGNVGRQCYMKQRPMGCPPRTQVQWDLVHGQHHLHDRSANWAFAMVGLQWRLGVHLSCIGENRFFVITRSTTKGMSGPLTPVSS